jgi:hypothetical protein
VKSRRRPARAAIQEGQRKLARKLPAQFQPKHGDTTLVQLESVNATLLTEAQGVDLLLRKQTVLAVFRHPETDQIFHSVEIVPADLCRFAGV